MPKTPRFQKQPNYIKHARSFGRGSGKRKKTTSFADSVATMRLPRARRRTERSKIYGKLLKYTLILIMIAGWGSLPIYLPYFRISSVTYAGFNSNDLEKHAEEKVGVALKNEKPWWPHNNFFILNADALQQNLLTEPRFRSVEVKKIFPHNLAITVSEKSSHLVYFSASGQNAILDEDGGFQQAFSVGATSSLFLNTQSSSTVSAVVSSSAFSASVSSSAASLPKLVLSDSDVKSIPLGMRSLPRLIDYRNTPAAVSAQSDQGFSTAEPLISKELAHSILAWSDALSTSSIGKMVVTGIDGEASPYRLIIKSQQQPWVIITDITKNPTEQLSEISLLIKTQKPQSYIDMRYDGRIYWK